MDCLFCKIVQGQIDADIVYEDDQVIAFNDIAPMAPIHQLIIPRRHISTLNDLNPDDAPLAGHMILVAQQLAQQHGIDSNGYRLLFNCNHDGGQTVFHIHLHLLAGRQMNWPPG